MEINRTLNLKIYNMHRIERNILHHAKQNRELRKYLMHRDEMSNGVIKRTYLNKDGSIHSVRYF